MRQYRNILKMTCILTTSLLATESFLLPEVVKQDANFKIFAERAFNRSQQKLAPQPDVIDNTQRFLKIDFDLFLSQFHDAFGFLWTPQQEHFDNERLQALFTHYHTRTAEHEKPLIFSANILYIAGLEMFEKNEDYHHLEQAAIIGHHYAQFEMFKIKYRESAYQQSMNYLLSSAAQKNPKALSILSDVYVGFWPNIIASKDNTLAKLLCEEAAKQSDEAIFTLRVATKTEGFFGETKNFQEGIKAAKGLAESGNKRAIDFLESLKRSSGESLFEMFNLTNKDFQFLSEFIQWKDDDE
ncbi:MAG: hypothetical protein HEEMFOPI_01631 [Holosporales bacterium]